MTTNLCTVLLSIPQEPVKMGHSAADEFVRMDPYGIGMAFIAMSIVFSVLAIVYLFFKNISKVYFAFQNRSVKKEVPSKTVTASPEGIEAEVSAAIGMALHMYHHRQHDMESLKITIQKVSKLYSPWNSKLYMINRLPGK
jgi:Na+-transporting methylmalonyl-CoA/oxaloacetate decarboxylase gamma subunit